MTRVGFEPTISAGERPKTYALDRAANGTGYYYYYYLFQLSCHSVAVVLTLVQTKQIRIITNIPPIMIINKIYETQNLISL